MVVDRLLNVAEAAERLGLPTRTLRDKLRQHPCAFYQLGGRRYKAADLAVWLEQFRDDPPVGAGLPVTPSERRAASWAAVARTRLTGTDH